MLKENQIGHEPNIKILLALYFPCIFHLFFFVWMKESIAGRQRGRIGRKEQHKRCGGCYYFAFLFSEAPLDR